MTDPRQPPTFFVSDDGESTKGPYVMAQIHSMWSRGVLTALALYWHDESQEWRPLRELLAPSSAPAPAPPASEPRPIPILPHPIAPPAATAPSPAPPALPPRSPLPPLVAVAGDTTGHPWLRLFARYIDLQIYALVSALLLALLLQILSSPPRPWSDNWNTLSMGAFFFVGMVGEGLFLTIGGCTPGKWLFGLRLTDLQGRNITAQISNRRFIAVLWRWIPLALLFCGPLAYRDLTRTGSTKWDKRLQCRVEHAPQGALRTLLGLLLIFFFVGSSILLGVRLRADERNAIAATQPFPTLTLAAPPAPPTSSPASSRPSIAATRPAPLPGYHWVNPANDQDFRQRKDAPPAAQGSQTAPPASTAPPPAASPRQNRILYASAVTGTDGKLHFENPGEQDAIVKMIDADTGRKILAFFIRAQSHFDMKDLPRVNYQVVFSFGQTILTTGNKDNFADPTLSTQYNGRLDCKTSNELSLTLPPYPIGNPDYKVIQFGDFNKL
jgi:hypothetical protein